MSREPSWTFPSPVLRCLPPESLASNLRPEEAPRNGGLESERSRKMGEYALGQPVPRFEDLRLLRGGGRYVADMVLPGMVWGHVLRSPHAHARILKLDTSRAAAAPGVLAVLTHKEWAESGYGDLPIAGGFKRR